MNVSALELEGCYLSENFALKNSIQAQGVEFLTGKEGNNFINSQTLVEGG